MKRPRLTLGLVLVAMNVVLWSLQPTSPRLPRKLSGIRDVQKTVRKTCRARPVRRAATRIQVVKGSLAALVADTRHSAGLDLVDRLNDHQSSSSVATGSSYAALAADTRHSFGSELVKTLNASSDGPQSVLSPNEALLAARYAGWSGCNAFSHGCDEWGGHLAIHSGRAVRTAIAKSIRATVVKQLDRLALRLLAHPVVDLSRRTIAAGDQIVFTFRQWQTTPRPVVGSKVPAQLGGSVGMHGPRRTNVQAVNRLRLR